MDWPRPGAILHTTGLWGRSYLCVGRRCCQQNQTESSVKEKTQVYYEGPYRGRIHICITQRGIRPYGHLAQYRGWPETAPSSLTAGGAGGTPPGFAIQGTELEEEKRHSHPRVRGNGTASMTPASSSRPLPVTQHTGRNWLNVETVESCEDVRCRPARSSADVRQRGAVHQCIGGGTTPSGVSPHSQGARLALRLVCQADGIHYPVGQPSISADLCVRQRAAQSFWSSGCGPRICAMLLRDSATLRLDLPPPRAVLAGSPPDRGRAWWEPWARIQAGVSRQRETRPARTQGTLCLPKMLGGPWPFWWKWVRSGALS